VAICLVIFSFPSSASVPLYIHYYFLVHSLQRGADKMKKKMKILFKNKIKFTLRRLDDAPNLIHNRLLLA
jgi:hypothetical protein